MLSGEVEGRKMSGDNDTGTGNILVMVAMDYAYCESRNIEKYEIFNDGDDSGVILEEDHLSAYLNGISEWFWAMGFSVVVEKPVWELEQILFCQSQPVFDGSGYVMVRNPLTALRKDATSITPLRNATEYSNWIKSVGVGGLSISGGLPVWQDFYSLLERSAGRKAKVTSAYLDYGLKQKMQGMKREYSNSISDQTRLSFYKAFGVTPAHQVALERRFKSMDVSYESSLQEFDLVLTGFGF